MKTHPLPESVVVRFDMKATPHGKDFARTCRSPTKDSFSIVRGTLV